MTETNAISAENFINQQEQNLTEYKQAKQYLYYLLSRRDHSQVELKHKLADKGYQQRLIVTLLAEFVDSGYQSDRRFAAIFIKNKAQRGDGPNKIKAALRMHQLDDELYYELEAELELDWLAILLALHQKKFKGQVANDYKDKQKQARYFFNKGFTSDIINLLWQELTSR